MIVELPSDFSTRKRALSTCAIASLVVVLPAEPVTPISGFPQSLRTAVAKDCSATSVSSTASRRVLSA